MGERESFVKKQMHRMKTKVGVGEVNREEKRLKERKKGRKRVTADIFSFIRQPCLKRVSFSSRVK